MLRHTFIHIPGFGAQRESRLWQQGILSWTEFLAATQTRLAQTTVYRAAAPLVRNSLRAVESRDVPFFDSLLKRRDTWRLYSEFADCAVFLDVETTGMSPYGDEVTMIGTLANGSMALFINGVNLDDFPQYIAQFPLLVTFNGSQFDLPFLQAHFPEARLHQAHIDIRFVLRSLGYRGSLKTIERNMGIVRDPTIQGLDGSEAVRLWQHHKRGDRAALMKLATYNLTDVVNVARLTDIAIRAKTRLTTYPGSCVLEERNTGQATSELIHAWLIDSFESLF